MDIVSDGSNLLSSDVNRHCFCSSGRRPESSSWSQSTPMCHGTTIREENVDEKGDSFPSVAATATSSTTTPIRESILSLLKDTDAYPPGSLPSSLIKDAERALESWTTTAPTALGSRFKTQEQHHDSYEHKIQALDNAMFLLTRLLQEQKECYRRRCIRGQYHDNDGSLHIDEGIGTEEADCFHKAKDDLVYHDDDDREYHSKRARQRYKPYTVRTFLLNRVVDFWRILWTGSTTAISTKQNKDLITTSIMSPADMIGWIDRLEEDTSSSSSSSSQLPARPSFSDNRTWTLIIDALCRRGDPFETPLVAQWLLDRRLDMARTYEDDYCNRDGGIGRNDVSDNKTRLMMQLDGDQEFLQSLRPDTFFITNVIRAWAKSGRLESPEMAEGLLYLMYDLLDVGWTNSGPNTMSFGVVMDAWSRSQRPDACDRIGALLEEMKSSRLGEDIEPDRVCYQYALNCLTKSINEKSPKKLEKAHHLLQEMVSLYRHAGNERVAPNASNFATVMMAAARRGDIDRVEALYEQLEDIHRASRRNIFRPNLACRKALLLAKAKSGAAPEAQGLLDEIVEISLANDHNHDLMPARSFFVDVLVAWTNYENSFTGAKRAQDVLSRMIDLSTNKGYRHLFPDTRLFEKVILAWSRARVPYAPVQIEKLVNEMDRLGYRPTLPTYTNHMLAYVRSSREDAAFQVQKIFDVLSSRCARGQGDMCPDRYIYGIVIDAWGEEGDFEKAEQHFSEMLDAWKSGNQRAKPDVDVFIKILKACSKVGVDTCEKYIALMKEIGLPVPVAAYTQMLHAMTCTYSSEINKGDIIHVIDDVLQEVEAGTVRPPTFKQYKNFLQAIVNCNIQGRSVQAHHQLKHLEKGCVPRQLLPALTITDQDEVKDD